MYCLGTGHSFISQSEHFTQKYTTYNLFCKILFHKMKIIKLVRLISVENCIFITKCFSSKSYFVFSYLYILATGRHNHQTRFAINGLLILLSCNTSKFGTKDFLYSTKNFKLMPPIKPEKVIQILSVFIICFRNNSIKNFPSII